LFLSAKQNASFGDLDVAMGQSYCNRRFIDPWAYEELRMHTIIVTAAGLVLLGLFLILSRFWAADPGVRAVAAKAFIPVWLSLTLVNLWIGVSYAGYTVAQELPILLITFGIPAAAAFAVIRLTGGRRSP